MRIKKLLFILVPSILLSGCAFNDIENDLVETTESEEVSLLSVVDDSLSINNSSISLDDSVFTVDKEDNILKFNNTSDSYFKNISGKIFFLGEDNNIENIISIHFPYVSPGETIYFTPYKNDMPSNYNKCVLDLQGIDLGESLINYKDYISISSEQKDNGIFAEIKNDSEQDLNTFDLKVFFYKNNELVHSENFVLEKLIESGCSSYERIASNYFIDNISYDSYEVVVDLALKESFVN